MVEDATELKLSTITAKDKGILISWLDNLS